MTSKQNRYDEIVKTKNLLIEETNNSKFRVVITNLNTTQQTKFYSNDFLQTLYDFYNNPNPVGKDDMLTIEFRIDVNGAANWFKIDGIELQMMLEMIAKSGK